MTLNVPRTLLSAALGLSLGIAMPAFSAPSHPQFQADAEQYKAPALKLLERLVNIDSGSGSEPGLTQVREIAVDELKQLGFSIE